MSDTFDVILTNYGLAKQADAILNNTQINATHIAVGDANGAYYDPLVTQTELIHEVWRGVINNKYKAEDNDKKGVYETIIPIDAGGFSIREVGVFDNLGGLLAVGKFPYREKPLPDTGVSSTIYVLVGVEFSNSEIINITVDETTVIASKDYVDTSLEDKVSKIGDLMTGSLDFSDFGVAVGADGQITIGKNFGWLVKNMLSHHWTEASGEYTELNVPSSTNNSASLKLYANGDLYLGSTRLVNFDPNSQNLKGTSITISHNTIYQAATNGFLYVAAYSYTYGTSTNFEAQTYVDTNSIPTTIRWKAKRVTNQSPTSSESYATGWIPINKGEYYKVVVTAGTFETAIFYPFCS